MARGVAFTRRGACRAGIQCDGPRGGNECSAGSVARTPGQGRSSASIAEPPLTRTPLTRTPAHAARLLVAISGATARNDVPGWTMIGTTHDDHTSPAVAHTLRARATTGARVGAEAALMAGRATGIAGQAATTGTHSTIHAPPKVCARLPSGAALRPPMTAGVWTTAPRIGATIAQAPAAMMMTTGGTRAMRVRQATVMATVGVVDDRPRTLTTWAPTATNIPPPPDVTTGMTMAPVAAPLPANVTSPRRPAGSGRTTTRIPGGRPSRAARWKTPGECQWPPAGPTRAPACPRRLAVGAALVAAHLAANVAESAERRKRSRRASPSIAA